VTAYGQSHLFHNNGNGTFTDVTQKAGFGGVKEFSTSAAWVDYDKDGRLDLVVANYVTWSPEADLYCTMDGRANRIAHRSRIRVRRFVCGTTMAMELSRM